jgi:hypothetical protein
MVNGLLSRSKHANEQHHGADHHSCTALSCLAMHNNCWGFVRIQVYLILVRSLQEKGAIEAKLNHAVDAADVMISEGKLANW